MPHPLTITKAHAYGNDFLFALGDAVGDADLPALARTVCARHTGIGGDGLIVYGFTPDGATMRLLNADGSPSELSGNGLRCLAALVMRDRERRGDGGRLDVHAATDAGERHLMLTSRDGAPLYLPRRDGAPAGRPPGDAGGRRGSPWWSPRSASATRSASRSCTPLPDRARFERLGPGLATHPRFPAGTNVEFAVVEAPDRVRILIWERGVGPTEASGTGACAAAITAMSYGGAARSADVVSPGGTQRVEWTGDGVFLTGWAEILFDATWLG